MKSVQGIGRLVVGLSIAAGFGLVGCDSATKQTVTATVFTEEGATILRKKGERLAGKGENLLRRGDRLITSSRPATVLLLPGLRVVLGRDSELAVRELMIQKDGNDTAEYIQARLASVELLRGSLVATVANFVDGDATTLEIVAPSGVYRAHRSTVFSLREENDRASLICANGSVTHRLASAGQGPVSTVKTDELLEIPRTNNLFGRPNVAPGPEDAIQTALDVAYSAIALERQHLEGRRVPQPVFTN